MSDNQKKILANRIKADLQKELASGDLAELSDYGLVSGNDNIFAISEYFICSLRKHIFKPSDFEKNDYDEIVSLIRQRLQLRTEALAKERSKKSAKLDSNPNLFYHSACALYKAGAYEEKGMRWYHQFWGRKNRQDYHVNVALDHSALNSVIFRDKFANPKQGNYYLIEGVENLPNEPNIPQHWEVEGHFFKWVELENNITITPYNDNSEPKVSNDKKKEVGICNKCGADYRNIESWYYTAVNENKEATSWDKLDWFCGKCWQTEEKNYQQRSSRKNTIYKSEPQKVNLGDEHHYYFENGQWISLESGTPDPNTNKGIIENGDKDIHSPNSILNIFEKETNEYLNKNKSVKDLHISFLSNLFKNWNIKSIELTNPDDVFSDLIIIYNDGRQEICKYDAPDGDESNLIRRALKTVNEKSLDRQKLEKIQTNSSAINPTNSSPTNYVPYLIGGAVVTLILGVVLISYRLIKRKK